jgi:hypothetical protein
LGIVVLSDNASGLSLQDAWITLEQVVPEGCRPRSAPDLDPDKRQPLRIEINNLEDAEGYFSILMTGAVEPRRNFIYINALAARVDA